MRDYQKSRVYKWEDKHIGPLDRTKITFDVARVIVNHIWTTEGLQYPPSVVLVPAQTRNKMGCANRSKIQLVPELPTWVVIHEIAHSMNSTNTDEHGDGHGPNYVGIYIKLLAKYLNASLPVMMYTLTQSDIDFNLTARPLFLK